MKQRIFSTGLLLMIAVLTGAALYRSGNYVVYMLAYIFSFVFLLCLTAFEGDALQKKAARIAVYAVILAAQILFAALVVRPLCGAGQLPELYRLLSVLIILVPFLLRQVFFFQHAAD